MEKESVERCPECGCEKVLHDHDAGEVVCIGCGLVLEERTLNPLPGWRVEEEEKKHAGLRMRLSIYDKGLSTSIMRIERSSSGKKLTPSTISQVWRLRKWQIRSRAYNRIERNLVTAMAELERLSGRLQLPRSTKERAAFIYRKALELNLVRGRRIAAMVAAAIYAACRDGKTPRTIEEIVEEIPDMDDAKKKEVLRCYRLIVNRLNIRMPTPDPVKYVSKIAEPLKISMRTQNLAVKTLREAQKKMALSGKEPSCLAATALYIACLKSGENKTQVEIANAAGVTEVTIRNHVKTFEKLGLVPRKRGRARRKSPSNVQLNSVKPSLKPTFSSQVCPLP